MIDQLVDNLGKSLVGNTQLVIKFICSPMVKGCRGAFHDRSQHSTIESDGCSSLLHPGNSPDVFLENTPPEFMLCRSLTGKEVPHGFLANPVNPGFFPGEVKSQREDYHHIEMIRLKSEQGIGIKNRIFCII
mgnify:FL=1